MEKKIIKRQPLGNPRRLYRQDRFIISTFNADCPAVRGGIRADKDVNLNMVERGWGDPRPWGRVKNTGTSPATTSGTGPCRTKRSRKPPAR